MRPDERPHPAPGVYRFRYRDGSDQVSGNFPDDETAIQAAKDTFGDLNEIVAIRRDTTGSLVWSLYVLCEYVSTDPEDGKARVGPMERNALIEHSDNWFIDHGVRRVYDEDGATLWTRP